MIISVESNIGAGKKIFLKYLSECGWNVRYEPVALWKNVAGNNLLDLFRFNPRQFGFLFQSYAMETLTVEPVDSILITERSIFSCHEIFSRQLRSSGVLSQVEYDVLSGIYERKKKVIDAFVYLQCTPNTCLDRIEDRNRIGDLPLNYDLVKDLHQIHEDMFWKNTIGTSMGGVPLLVLEWDDPKLPRAEFKLKVLVDLIKMKNEESSESES